jgi:7-carboxy-7-deazaguanine synthase
MTAYRYPLARDGVFATVQGEGLLLGVPTVFVRLGGCSEGCPGCDTDYRVASRATAAEIAKAVVNAAAPGTEWVWVTGGEPTDHDLAPLLDALHGVGMRAALATCGKRRVVGEWDFVSVSPHSWGGWVQRAGGMFPGSQLNVVPGLNGLRLADAPTVDPEQWGACWVTPLHGDVDSLADCRWWVDNRKGWRLGIQAHKQWGLK